MSITSVKPVYDLGQSGDYLEFGVGDKKKEHKASGTDRLAPGFYCDAPSIDAFIEMGNHLAKENSRRVKAHGYVLSFSPNELDVNNPHDLRRAGDLGFLLAKKMRPNSPALVVVHDDGNGGCAHAHIMILNHDTVTGKAPRDHRVHWQVKKANDDLMREEGMAVVVPKNKTSKRTTWSDERGSKSEFDQMLGDAISDARAASSGTDMVTFAKECSARGVEFEEEEFEVKSGNRQGLKRGDTAIGITYKMHDDVTPNRKARVRRRKASSLSLEFTKDGLTEAFEEEVQATRTTSSKGKVAAKPEPRHPASEVTLATTQSKPAGTGTRSFAEMMAENEARLAELEVQANEERAVLRASVERAKLVAPQSGRATTPVSGPDAIEAPGDLSDMESMNMVRSGVPPVEVETECVRRSTDHRIQRAATASENSVEELMATEGAGRLAEPRTRSERGARSSRLGGDFLAKVQNSLYGHGGDFDDAPAVAEELQLPAEIRVAAEGTVEPAEESKRRLAAKQRAVKHAGAKVARESRFEKNPELENVTVDRLVFTDWGQPDDDTDEAKRSGLER